MKLTLHTDYAMRALLYLAEREGELCSITEISQTYGISHNHLMKVVHELGKKGFVTSVRGRSGGIRLARPTSQIVVGDVVRRMEEDFEIVDCPSCRIVGRCGLRSVFGEALVAFLAVLDRYTLADLMTKSPGRSVLFATLLGKAS